ncbi:MAG: UvrD-helicase domain-containing protein [Fermentimonas sp.]|jgi:ATP-dependent helicase/nuclease subunit A
MEANDNISDGLLVLKASAGSGKTHRLTGEYIKLLFSDKYNNNNGFRHILAVTFTNKATDEMKSRIIKELDKLATGEKSDYLDSLIKGYGLTEQSVRKKAGEILRNILHDYSSFTISTIDKFFQQIMRAFTREIGVGGGYNVEVDHSMMLMEAIDLMISELDKKENKILTDWMLDFMKSRIEEGQSWKIKDEINNLAKELFNETYKSFATNDRNLIKNKEELGIIKKQLQEIINDRDQRLKDIGAEASEIIDDCGLTYTDFKSGSNGPLMLFKKLSNGEVKEIKLSRTFRNLVDNVENWYSKASKKIEPIKQAYDLGLNEMVREVIDLIEKNEIYYSAVEIIKNFHTLGILNDINERLKALQKETNTLFLSDTTELLKNIIADSDSPFIYEKTGTRIFNYMIDEFQDTSRMQWDNFKPLIEESIGNGNFNLIVGDVKQSIYRFRNSDWKLLESQIYEDLNRESITDDVLETNWRSDKNIICFNNNIFEGIPKLLQDSYNNVGQHGEEKDEDEQICKVYEDVKQEVAKKNLNTEGYVKLAFIDDKEERGWEYWSLEQMITDINELIKKKTPQKEIAILVRKKDEAVKVAKRILEHNEKIIDPKEIINIVSDEGLLINNSKIVKAVISILRHLRSPNDATIKMIAFCEYCRFNKEFSWTEALEEYGKYGKETFDFPDDFKEQLTRLSSLPFYDMIEGFFSLFSGSITKHDIVYVQAFLDLALKFSYDSASDINAFLDWWDEVGIKKTIPSSEDQDAVRIMTIHKSKGLEFGAVIMPFTNWNIDNTSSIYQNNYIWVRPNQRDDSIDGPFKRLSVAPLTYKKSLEKTIFKDDYLAEKKYTYIDKLNLLYVAFTRAKSRLYAYAKKPSEQNKEQKINSVDNLLWNYLLKKQELKEVDNGCVYEFGDPDAIVNHEKKPGSTNDSNFEVTTWKTTNYNNRLKMKLNSIGYFTDDGSRDYGNLMHDIVSKIDTLGDIERSVEAKVSDGEISESEQDDIVEELRSYLNIPEARDWYSGEYQVLNEIQILDSSRGVSRPDRVMIGDNKVIVVDYKFGESEDSRYIRQVESYISTISNMGYSNVKGAVFYVKMGKVVTV